VSTKGNAFGDSEIPGKDDPQEIAVNSKNLSHLAAKPMRFRMAL
jgi:hypothetical protein